MATAMTMNEFAAQGCWQQTMEVASRIGGSIGNAVTQAGTWAVNGGTRAVTWVRDWVVYVGKAIKEGAATMIKLFLDTAYKTWQFVKPHIAAFASSVQQSISSGYNSVRSFVQAHPNETLVGLVAFALGILITLSYERITGC